MKTLQFDKGACRLVESSAPAPGRGEVLVRFRGTILDETHLSDYRTGERQAPYLVSGEVLQPGEGVIDFRCGQPVVMVASQPLCQYLLARPEDLLPIDNNRGAACLLLGIALALRAVPLAERYPESTVIGGAGFVGLTLSTLLPTTTPWFFGTSDAALVCARDLGAMHCKEWEDALSDLDGQGSGERGYGAMLIETTGRLQDQHRAQRLTLKGGTVVLAMPPGSPGETLELDATRIHYDQITWQALGPCEADDLSAAAKQLDRIPDTVITEQLSFHQMERAFEDLDSERGICYLVTDDSDL